jgi:hypothetical protein
MTRTVLANVRSRWTSLVSKLRNRTFRHAYFEKSAKAYLANQIRALRGELSQAEFGKLIGSPQSVVSRLEDESYGKLNTQTLVDIAKRLDVAVVVKFVDYPTFLNEIADVSTAALVPAAYSDSQLNALAVPSARTIVTSSAAMIDMKTNYGLVQTSGTIHWSANAINDVQSLIEAQ